METNKYKRNPKKRNMYYKDWWLITIVNPFLRYLSEWGGVIFIALFGILYFGHALNLFHLHWLAPLIKGDIKTAAAVVAAVISYFGIERNTIKYAEIRMELSKQFNDKYDKMNNCLGHYMRIVESEKPKDTTGIEVYDEAENKVYDYFNLCVEEYYYYVKGLIDNRTWKTWFDGIQDLLKRYPKVAELWATDFFKNDYYGSYFVFKSFLSHKEE